MGGRGGEEGEGRRKLGREGWGEGGRKSREEVGELRREGGGREGLEGGRGGRGVRGGREGRALGREGGMKGGRVEGGR